MAWAEHEDDRANQPPSPGRMKICAVCRKIILRKDDLVIVKGKVYCAEHAPAAEGGVVAVSGREDGIAQARPAQANIISSEPLDERQPVESSNIAKIGYDAETRTLEIEFLHSGVYRYHHVPADVHAALMASPSKGRYFAINVRNKYHTERVKERA